MELELEDLEGGATEDELAAEEAAVRAQTVRSFERKRPARKPLPAHLLRERIVIPAPGCCPCCGSAQLSKLGEDGEVIPRRWKVIQTVREKFCIPPRRSSPERYGRTEELLPMYGRPRVCKDFDVPTDGSLAIVYPAFGQSY
jgi:hypothetical protein